MTAATARPRSIRRLRRGRSGIRAPLAAALIALLSATSLPANASCKTALPTEELRWLDASADVDPLNAVKAARDTLQTVAATDELRRAELYAIIADAYDTLNDDVEARAAVAAGRHSLALLPQEPAVQELGLRLDLVDADAAQGGDELESALQSINSREPGLGADALGRACLLLVRGRLQGRLNHPELAARDGLEAYQLTVRIGAGDGRAEAAYQLGATYRRAGLFADALRMSDEFAAYARAKGQAAALGTALWEKAQILDEMGQHEPALALLAESKQLSQQLNDAIGVAFSDHERCYALLELKRLDEAAAACLAAERVFRSTGRVDQAAGTLGRLAQIDLVRGHPQAALVRLNTALQGDGKHAPPSYLPRLYQDLSEALARVGRTGDALRALRSSLERTELADQRRRSLAVALQNAQMQSEQHERERAALQHEVLAEHERTESREVTRRLAIGLAIAGLALSLLIGYLLYTSRRHARELRYREAILRQTSENAPDSLVLLDADGRTRFANRSLFGSGTTPSVDQPLAESVPADTRAAIGSAVTSLLDRREPVALDIRRPVGNRTHFFDVRGVPIVEDGQLLGATLRVSDVTELRTLEQRILDVAAEERQHLSSDLHEGLGQELTGISLLLRSAATAVQRGRADVGSLVAEASRHTEAAIAATRDLARGFSPVQIEQGSLSVALERLAADAGRRLRIGVQSHSQPADVRVPAMVSDHLYRIAYEAVTNAARHSGCSKVDIDLRLEARSIVLTVTDDGSGFTPRDPLAPLAGLGTKMMVYRARLLGGTLRFDAAPGGGTRVVVNVPLPTGG